MSRQVSGLLAIGLFVLIAAGCGVPGVQLGIFPPLQSSAGNSDVTGLRLSLICSSNRDVTGVDLGLLGNGSESHWGVTVSGLIGYCGGTMEGLQVSGLWSNASALNGFQVSGLVSQANSLTSGVQISGIANYGAGPGLTAQAAGGVNYCDSIGGAQAAVIANVAEHGGDGVQVGLFNVAKGVLSGFQFGLFNSADRLCGIQVGLLNRTSSGWMPVAPILNFGFED